ncbi:thioredoxin [candidate division KSB1 bacterium]|nr:thioredoxin [candidate division KSB1 bacterium]
MLMTKLEHLEGEGEIKRVLRNNENVMICCGWNSPMCILVCKIMAQLEVQYPHVAFRDLDFDIPDASFIKKLPECALFKHMPFNIYFKKGEIVDITTCVQSKKQIVKILDREFGPSNY